MWFFMPTGFVSVVADREDPTGEYLLVRARSKDHLRAFAGDDHDMKLEETSAADYRWRTWMTREDVSIRIAAHVATMTYSNFKNAIPREEHRYHDACMDVWSAMHGFQLQQTTPQRMGRRLPNGMKRR